MKKRKYCCLIIILIIGLYACEKADVPEKDIPEKEQEIVRKDTVLRVIEKGEQEKISLGKVAVNYVKYNDKIYAVDESKTYSSDINQKDWKIINSDNSNVPKENFGYGLASFSFIKDNYWYLFCNKVNSFHSNLLKFNLDTQVWEMEQSFDGFEFGLSDARGVFHDNRLFLLTPSNSWTTKNKVVNAIPQ